MRFICTLMICATTMFAVVMWRVDQREKRGIEAAEFLLEHPDLRPKQPGIVIPGDDKLNNT
jgi:hypothetical protein